MRISDWSSDVCSSDLLLAAQSPPQIFGLFRPRNGSLESGMRGGGWCLFQPDLRAMDGAVDGNAVALPSAGAVANFGRAPSLERPTAAARLRSLAPVLSGAGALVVDSGRPLGSANWLRGAITVALTP